MGWGGGGREALWLRILGEDQGKAHSYINALLAFRSDAGERRETLPVHFIPIETRWHCANI